MANSPEHMPIECGVFVSSDAEVMASLLGEVFSRHDQGKVGDRRAPAAKSFIGSVCTGRVENALFGRIYLLVPSL